MTTERWGGDGLGPEDMAIPEIKLVQNVGGDLAKDAGANPGDFYCSLTDEVIKGEEGFDIVVVAMQKNRTYWGRDDIADEPPECASLNAASMLSINGDDCKACPHRNEAPWLLSPTDRRAKCLINYNVLGVNFSDGLPILLRTSGISAQAAKELYTQLSLNKHLIKGWYKARTHVSSTRKKTSAGDAFAIKFGKLELIEDKNLIEEFRTQSSQLIGTQIALPEGRDELSGDSEEQLPEKIGLDGSIAVPPPKPAPEAKTTPPASRGPAKKDTEVPPEHKETPPIDMDF